MKAAMAPPPPGSNPSIVPITMPMRVAMRSLHSSTSVGRFVVNFPLIRSQLPAAEGAARAEREARRPGEWIGARRGDDQSQHGRDGALDQVAPDEAADQGQTESAQRKELRGTEGQGDLRQRHGQGDK